MRKRVSYPVEAVKQKAVKTRLAGVPVKEILQELNTWFRHKQVV